MSILSSDNLLVLILVGCLLLMVLINVFMLIRFLPLIDAEHRHAAVPSASGDDIPAAETDASWLDRMAGLFGAIPLDDLGEAGKSMEASAAILGDLAAVGNEQLAAWREANQQRVDSLLAEHRRQHQSLIQMRDSLAQAQATINSLRGQAPRSAIAAAQVAALKAENAEHEVAIRLLTAERTQYQRELGATREKLESLRAEIPAGRQELEAANVRLQREVGELRTATKMLEENNADLQATYERTIQEKLFVEEAFVKLDNYLFEQAPAVSAGGGPRLISEEAA